MSTEEPEMKMTRAEIARAEIARGKQKCPRCADYFYPRNWKRHVKACNRKHREVR